VRLDFTHPMRRTQVGRVDRKGGGVALERGVCSPLTQSHRRLRVGSFTQCGCSNTARLRWTAVRHILGGQANDRRTLRKILEKDVRHPELAVETILKAMRTLGVDQLSGEWLKTLCSDPSPS
jgi:hypothetical protein